MVNLNTGSTGNVNIPGALHSISDENIVAYSGDIYDSLRGKNLSTILDEKDTDIRQLSERVSNNETNINSKVIEAGGVMWDVAPTENSTNALTSGKIYANTVNSVVASMTIYDDYNI